MLPTEKVPTTRIDGENVVLLPYTPALVPIYHSWMQDPTLLELTASEPLSLEEEYANQRSWDVDPTKYCWIMHSKRPVIKTFRTGKGVDTGSGIDYTLEDEKQAEEMKKPVNIPWEEHNEHEAEHDTTHNDNESDREREPEPSESKVENSSAMISPPAVSISVSGSVASSSLSTSNSSGNQPCLSPLPSTPAAPASSSAASSSSSRPSGPPYPLTPIGDVNLFLHDDFNLGDYGISGGGCEIEIMIADQSYRRRGLGVESLRLLMEFSAECLGIERFVVKISASNKPSLALFEKVGFKLVEYVECFEEMVYILDTSVGPLSRGFSLNPLTSEAAEEQQQEQQENEPQSQAVNEPEASVVESSLIISQTNIASVTADLDNLHTEPTVTTEPSTSSSSN